jgi:predicted ATPase/DNA-binding XRE family transcriptional regulator
MSERLEDWIRRRRRALDLTQKDLAERVACSPETIKKIETGQRQPSRQLAVLLMRELKVAEEERAHFLSLARGIEYSAPPSVNLPIPLTSLIDRADEIAGISRLLLSPEVRLLTLTGPGGVGKTRLAIQAAHSLQDKFKEVHLVSLAAVNQTQMVLPAVAHALELSASSEKSARMGLVEFLQGRQVLMLLDNFEQILPSAVEVRTLLADLPQLKILVTSRARLNIYGEHEYSVPSMQLPDLDHLPPMEELAARSPAVDLFVRRVQSIRPGFQLSGANARSVAEICTLLGGIPLAIELAAARCDVFDPPDLLERLTNSSALNLLTLGPQDLPPRQQTLRRTIDWSYNLLNPQERLLFERLGIFADSVTLESLESVCGESDPQVPDTVSALTRQNLIWRVDRPGVPPRFQMLDVLREYAVERLKSRGEWSGLQHRHAAHYATLLETVVPRLRTGDQLTALRQISSEHPNLRAALDWASSPAGDPEIGLRITAGLWEFWVMHGDIEEGYARSERLLAVPQTGPPTQYLAHTFNGMGVLAAIRMLPSEPWLCRSLTLFQQLDDPQGEAWAMNHLAQYASETGSEQALELLHESERLFRRLNAGWHLAWVLNNLADSAFQCKQMEKAKEYLAESLELFRLTGDQRGLAWTTFSYGNSLRVQGKDLESLQSFEQSLGLLHSVEDFSGASRVHMMAAWGALRLGNLKDASRHFSAGLRIYRHNGNQWDTAVCLVGLAHIALAAGRADEAATVLGAAISLFRSATRQPTREEQNWLAPLIETIQDRLDEVAYRQAWQAGFDSPNLILDEKTAPTYKWTQSDRNQ